MWISKIMSEVHHKIEHIRKIKRAEYGSFKNNVKLIGQSWQALLDLPQPIPGWKVCLMYVAAKLIRAAHTFKEDNYIDALNYLRKSEEMQREENDKKD